MKILILAAISFGITLSAVAQNGARPILLVDVSGNPYPAGSGTPLPYTPPSMICYTLSAGSILPCNFAAGGGGDTITSPNSTLSVGGTATATTLDINLAHSNIWTANGALSAPAMLLNGTPVTTGGTGTTTWPLFLLQPAGTTTTGWTTGGTMFGINAASGFLGFLMDLQVNGTHEFQITPTGSVIVNHYDTLTICSSAASPAVCGSSTAGSVAVAGSASTVQVNTTSVTANSQILLTFDSSLSTRLAVTCGTTIVQPTVSARTAGSNFTITLSAVAGASPDCISYTIIN
jgi:hypothetical protein